MRITCGVWGGITQADGGFDNPQIKNVLSGSGEKIGERIEYSFKKNDFQSLSYDEIKAFTDGTLSDYQKDGYNYCSIVFDDGTGICFAGCLPVLPMYGSIDGDGVITDTAGYIEDKETYFVLIDDGDKPLSENTEPNGINGI